MVFVGRSRNWTPTLWRQQTDNCTGYYCLGWDTGTARAGLVLSNLLWPEGRNTALWWSLWCYLLSLHPVATYLDPASKILVRGKMSAFAWTIQWDTSAYGGEGGLYPFCLQIKHGCISWGFKIHFLVEIVTGTVVETSGIRTCSVSCIYHRF